jgi:hypothetical protein
MKEKETYEHISRIERDKSLFKLGLELDHALVIYSKLYPLCWYKRPATLTFIQASIQRNRKACEGNRKDAKDTKDLVRVQTAALDSFMSKMESDQLTKQRNEILQWLYPEDPRLKHIEISGQRHAGTGEWLFEKPEFKNWIKE